MNLFSLHPGRTQTLAPVRPQPRSGSSLGAGKQGRGRKGMVGNWARGLYGQRRRLAIAAAALLAVGVGYHVVFGQNGLTAYQQKRHEEQTLTRQVQRLARDNDTLSGHVERLQSDPDAIEHQAREELHYTRTGEVIVTLPADPQSSR